MSRWNEAPPACLLFAWAGRWPNSLYDVDSDYDERHFAIQKLRLSRNGFRMLCAGPIRDGIGCCRLGGADSGPESTCSDRQRLLTARNRAGRDGMAPVKTAEPSGKPALLWPSRLKLRMDRNGFRQTVRDR